MSLHKVLIENNVVFHMCSIFQKCPHFANFAIGMIGNEKGHLLECVKFYGKFINMHETGLMYFTEILMQKSSFSTGL